MIHRVIDSVNPKRNPAGGRSSRLEESLIAEEKSKTSEKEWLYGGGPKRSGPLRALRFRTTPETPERTGGGEWCCKTQKTRSIFSKGRKRLQSAIQGGRMSGCGLVDQTTSKGTGGGNWGT